MKNLGLFFLSLTFLFCFSAAIYSQAEDIDTKPIVWQDPIMEKAIDGYMEFLRGIAETEEYENRSWYPEEAELRAKEERKQLENIVENNLLSALPGTIEQIDFIKREDGRSYLRFYSNLLAVLDRYTYYFDGDITTLADIKNFTELRYLTIYNIEFSDISALKDLKRLDAVALFGCSDASQYLGIISQLTSLTTLLFKDCGGIKDFSFLKNVAELKDLFLWNVGLTDLEVIGTLENLSTLYVNHNSITDLEPLKNLENLYWLDVSHNPITSFEPLRNMQGLSSLAIAMNFEDNFEIDVTPLSGIENLSLTHYGVPIANLHGLSTLPRYKTESVYITGVDSKGIEILSTFENLTEINFSLDTVGMFGDNLHLENADFSGFESLDNIESITFVKSSDVDYEDEYFEMMGISAMGDIDGLKYFSKWDLSPLAKMKNLKKVRFEKMSYSQINDDDITRINIDNITVLSNIEELLISAYVDFPPLDKMEGLKVLDITFLEDTISNDKMLVISKLNNLEVLKLPTIGEVDLSLLATFKNLKQFSASFEIPLTAEDMKTITSLTELESLMLFQNEKIDLSQIDKLKKLKTLRVYGRAPLTNDDVRAIAQLENLEELLLSPYILEDTDITPLLELPNLNERSRASLNMKRVWEEEKEEL